MTMWERLCHYVGFHRKEHFCENVHADGGGGVFTIGGWQCRCGRSRLRFVYHS